MSPEYPLCSVDIYVCTHFENSQVCIIFLQRSITGNELAWENIAFLNTHQCRYLFIHFAFSKFRETIVVYYVYRAEMD